MKVSQNQRLAVLVLLLAVVAVFQIPAFCQNISGSISGTVVDKTTAVIPAAKVVLKDEATNATRDTVTNASGVFVFSAVQPGSYSVNVSFSGLQTYERRGIVVTQGAVVGVGTITLQLAQTKTEIEVVSAAESMIPVDTPAASQTLNRQMVENLSIVGRDAAELIKIMPGMAMASQLGQGMWNSYTTANNTGPIGNFSASGTQPYGAMTMSMDGANLLDPGNQGTQTANVNQNQVAEVSILDNAYGAEFAKGPVTFQAIGKSGSAQFHGEGYFYARNSEFNAQDSYNKNQGAKPADDSYYYPGGNLGGPVLIPGTKFNRNHDKLFFFTGYEYMKQQPAGQLYSYFVPTPEMLKGNFSPDYIKSLGSGFANARSQAATALGGNAVSADGLSFPNGMIPQSLIDQNSLAYIKLFPQPNVNPATNSTGSNYQFFKGVPQNRFEYRLRLDYNLSERTKLYVSWNTQHEGDLSPINVWWDSGAAGGWLPYPSPQSATQTSNVYSANLTHVFSPTLTNEFVFADAVFVNPVHLTNPDAVNPSKVGFSMTGLFKDPYTPQIPNVMGWNNASVGFVSYQYGTDWPAGGANSFGKLSSAPSIADNMTWVKATHTVKAGFYGDWNRNNQTTGGEPGGPQGWFDMENWGAHSTGNPLADLIMGRPSQFTQQKATQTADFKYYTYAFYLNDQWKASRRLTFIGGLRFEHLGQWFPLSGPGLAVWDPTTYNNTSSAPGFTGLLWNATDKSIPKSGLTSRPFYFEPRFGVAYDLFGDGKTVLRGGAGLYRYQLAYNSISGDALNAPLSIPTLATNWGCCVGWNEFPTYSPAIGTGILGSAPNGIMKKGDDRTPYTWSYNFTISQRAPWRSVLELQYVGNQTQDMMLHSDLSNQNLIPLGAFFRPDPKTGVLNHPWDANFPTNDYYPLQNYTGMTLITHGSYSYYNSVRVIWHKQAGRATFTANYTFGKVLGIRDNQTDNGGAGNGSTVFPYALNQNYGVLGFDRTHIFNAAYVINLPKPVHDKVLGGFVNGWVISGITQAQSGPPLQPSTGGTLNVVWPGSSWSASSGCWTTPYVGSDGTLTCPGFSKQNYLGTNTNQLGLMPRLTCDPRNGLQSGQYFNPGCFAPPFGGMNGSFVWPYIKGPAFFNSDLAVYKTFQIKESKKVELRFSAFNFLNHALPTFGAGGNSDIQLNFQNSNGSLAQTNQNTLTTGFPRFTTGRRVVEFAAKFYF